MNPEGVARFFARDGMNEGPFPEHYEPFETSARLQPALSEQPSRPSAIRRRACSRTIAPRSARRRSSRIRRRPIA